MEMCVLGFSGGRGMKVLICLALIMALWLFGVGQLHGMKVNVFMNVDVIHNISILVCVCVCVGVTLCSGIHKWEGCESVFACGNDDGSVVIWGWPFAWNKNECVHAHGC